VGQISLKIGAYISNGFIKHLKNKGDINIHAEDKNFDLSPPQGKRSYTLEDHKFAETNCSPPSGLSTCVVMIKQVQ
jgi:hypothetical protein